jgi:hypothetical protein
LNKNLTMALAIGGLIAIVFFVFFVQRPRANSRISYDGNAVEEKPLETAASAAVGIRPGTCTSTPRPGGGVAKVCFEPEANTEPMFATWNAGALYRRTA